MDQPAKHDYQKSPVWLKISRLSNVAEISRLESEIPQVAQLQTIWHPPPPRSSRPPAEQPVRRLQTPVKCVTGHDFSVFGSHISHRLRDAWWKWL